MATPINAPLTSEIWHLSIDDLLEPMSEAPRLGGAGPFVINLSASSAPLSQPARTFTAPEGAYVYQIQRTEDRRPRYRLRLGPFATEDAADAMLAIVRDVYPSALTATAEADDLKAITAMKPKPESMPAAAVAPPAVRTSSAAPQVRTVSRSQPLPAALSIPVLSDSVAPARRAPAKAASIESTQTLRSLTPSELKDPGARWYVIQLSLSSESFDPDSLPNLDIFNEYRLYSVAGLDQGRIVHALRLGFFAEQGAAAAVASYLGAFYDKPTIRRISVAERERFRDQRVEARKDIGATGRHAVIEITGERHIRENRPRVATVTPLAPAAAFAQSTGTPARRGR